jgi:hypothetical protein
MEITLITGNKRRHKYFLNLLLKVVKKLNVIREIKISTKIKNKPKLSKNINKYFSNLEKIEKELFKIKKNKNLINKLKVYSVASNELNNQKKEFFENFKNTNLFILYGCSLVEGNLYNFLKKKKVICIHMGISPYYVGSDCNFWALYDNNPHLVGATIQKLSKKFEEGDIIYHSIPNKKKDPQEYSALASKIAFKSLIMKIKNKTLFKTKARKQNKGKIIRKTKKTEFTDKLVKKYFSMDINTKIRKFDLTKLKDPFF